VRNVRLKGPEAYEDMKRLAAKRGMTGPAETIAQELDSLKLNAVMHEAAQNRLHAVPLAIEGGEGAAEVVAEEESDEVVYDDEVSNRSCG
jgi:hypothetical protein